MRKWKKYLAAAFVTVLTASAAFSAFPQNALEVHAEDTKKIELAGYETGKSSTVCRYLDDNTDPAVIEGQTSYNKTIWTGVDFDASDWTSSTTAAKFGAKKGALSAVGSNTKVTPTVLLTHYTDDSKATTIPAYFFRTEFTVDTEDFADFENAVLNGTLYYDDGVVVYLNGQKIGVYGGTYADTFTEDTTTNLYYAGRNESPSDVAEATFSVDADDLKDGKNVLAVELHQSESTSSDIYYALESLTIEEGEESGQESFSETLIDADTVWSYYDKETDPVTSGTDRTAWTKASFDVSGWDTATGKFGFKNTELAEVATGYTPTVLLTKAKTNGDDIEAFFFRTTVKVNTNSIPDGKVLKGTIAYDDAALIYLNGELVAEFDNKQYATLYGTDGPFTENMQYGGHNSSSVPEVTFEIPVSKLLNGDNIIAVELHQGRPTSSDAYFEMSSLEFVDDAITQKGVSLTVGADETSRNLTWYADAKTPGYVEYAKKGTTDWVKVDATAEASNDGTFYSHKATLKTLDYNTEYVYHLVNGETVSDDYSFKTSGSDSFSFLAVGDPQIGASGNAATDTANWEKTLQEATTKFPDAAFLLSAGDQVNTHNSETEYAGYLESDVLKSLATATVIGNHDSGSAAYSQHFNNPNVSAYGKSAAGTDYYFVYNNVLVMSLNSNWSASSSSASVAEHKAFMKEAIEANPDVDWKVVTFHHSIYSAASHATQADILNRRDVYVPAFEELDIDVVLMGHDHVYVRSYMMDGLTPVVTEEVESSVTNPDEEILYVTFNSASGSKFYGITADYEYSAVQNQERTPNFSNIEVTENSFKITTYRVTSGDDNLSVVDEFTIYRDPETTKTVEAEVKTEGFDNEDAALELTKVAGYDSGIVNEEGGSAEIVQYNSDNDMYYVVNGTSGTLDIVPREVYTEDNQAEGIKFNLKTKLINYRTDFEYGDMTSVAVNTEKDLIAIAVQAADTNETGLIVLMNYDNEIVAVIDAGVQPDMVTFTADGNKVLSANEGEPRDGYGEGTTDPKGSITVADLSAGIDQISAQNITFDAWDAKRDDLTSEGVIIKKNTAPSVDFEPEYIAVNSAGTKAYVSLQEANAIATVDLSINTVTAIKSLGFKDHSQEENALDMLKKDGTIDIQTADVYGIYMPDGISVFEVGGTEYIVTANEGDSREWGDYINEVEEKVGESKSKVVFFDTSDYDGVDADKKYLFGGRSFSIYNAATMEQVYDSGSDFETITAEYLADYFNCSNDDKSMDDRSGKKGPEAESVVIGEVDGKTYAFIGLERIGGVMVYDITDPANAIYVNYINSRDFSDDIAGDVSPEGLCFVPESNELLVANEVSGTVAIYQLSAKPADDGDEGESGDGEDTETPDDSGDEGDQKNEGDQGNTDTDNDGNEGSQGTTDNDGNTGNQGNTNTGSGESKDNQGTDQSTATNSGSTTQNGTGVQTGDSQNIGLWISLMILAAIAGIGVIVVRKVLNYYEKK